MATYKLPKDGRFKQLNTGDIFGDIWSSWNIDTFSSPGKLKLARPLRQIRSDDDLDSDIPQAIIYAELNNSGERLWVVTRGDLYSGSGTDYATQENPLPWITASTSVQDATDAEVFQGQLVIVTNQNLDAYDGNTFTSNWWTGISGYSSTYAIPSTNPSPDVPVLLKRLRIGTETLVVTAGSSIHAYSGTIAGTGTLTTVDLDDSMIAVCVEAGLSNVFIGTYSLTGEEALVYNWDGASTNTTESYPSGAKAVLAMALVDNTPLIVTEKGEIKLFNNIGFTTVARFPFSLESVFPAANNSYSNSNHNNRAIHPKGIKVVDDKVCMFINFPINAPGENIPPSRSPGGVWVLDTKTMSLSHLASPGNEQVFDRVGPLEYIQNEEGRIIIGADSPTTGVGVWSEDLRSNSTQYGYFVTSEINADSVEDNFSHIIVKALLGSSDSVVVKYRGDRDVQLPIYSTVVWANATTFNTQDDLSYIKTRFDAGKRDEIEITTGTSAGRLAHVTDIQYNGSTYEVTIDESLGTASTESKLRFDNWVKIPETMTAEDGGVKRLGVGEVSSWIQFKIEMRGQAERPEVRELQIFTNTKQGK